MSQSSVFSMLLSLLVLNLFESSIKGMSSSLSELGHSFLQILLAYHQDFSWLDFLWLNSHMPHYQCHFLQEESICL